VNLHCYRANNQVCPPAKPLLPCATIDYQRKLCRMVVYIVVRRQRDDNNRATSLKNHLLKKRYGTGTRRDGTEPERGNFRSKLISTNYYGYGIGNGTGQEEGRERAGGGVRGGEGRGGTGRNRSGDGTGRNRSDSCDYSATHVTMGFSSSLIRIFW
jgi:hypothetical protein